MRKKFLILSIVFLLFLTLSYTYSAFNSAIVGNISGNIKDWVFKVSIDNSTTYNDSYKLHLTGTSGSFNVNINTVGGANGADYSIELIGDSSIKYYTDSGYTNLISNNIYKGSINSNTSGTITIYYKSSSNINSDILIKTKGSIMEIAMMKNGYSNSTEFWSKTYSSYIRTVEFGNDLSNLPSSCTEENLCWDISYSASQKKKVYGYLTDSGYKDSTDNTKTLYNLYIVSEVPIFAPSNCFWLFSFYKYESGKYVSNLLQINFNNNFDTSKVTTMNSMFGFCSSLTSLDLSSFNTSNVIDMNSMFGGCSSLTGLDLSNFNTSNVTDMNYMFGDCSSLTSLDLSNFNTSKVTDMASMFSGCSSLTNLDLSSFNTSNVTKYSNTLYSTGMFYNCSKLTTTINIMNANVTECTSMFNGAATDPNAKITVNYIEAASTLVDSMIATKSSNSNVVKGSVISEYSITISGNDDIEYESNNRLEGTPIKLTSISGNNYVTSFKMNGTAINGNEFTMPGSNVTITDIVTVPCKTIETAHYPYLNSQSNVVVGEYTFENAKSLTVILDYQTQGTFYDYFYIYDSSTATSGINYNKKYGGSTRTTETITINSNYIKITFTSNSYSNDYYGLKAIVIPNY